MSRVIGQLDKANPNWHAGGMDEHQLAAAAEEFRNAPRVAAEKRDAALQAAVDAGMGVMEIARITGFSRETIRLALNPAARAAVKQAAADRRTKKD
jgi:hypothetical protein